ncbi:hypothetical protein ACJX0J_013207, partial [Zea mays]
MKATEFIKACFHDKYTLFCFAKRVLAILLGFGIAMMIWWFFRQIECITNEENKNHFRDAYENNQMMIFIFKSHIIAILNTQPCTLTRLRIFYMSLGTFPLFIPILIHAHITEHTISIKKQEQRTTEAIIKITIFYIIKKLIQTIYDIMHYTQHGPSFLPYKIIKL